MRINRIVLLMLFLSINVRKCEQQNQDEMVVESFFSESFDEQIDAGTFLKHTSLPRTKRLIGETSDRDFYNADIFLNNRLVISTTAAVLLPFFSPEGFLQLNLI